MRDSMGTSAEGPSTAQPSQVLYKSLKLTMLHRLREDRPLTVWAIHGPHTLDLLRSLEPSSPGPSNIDTYDPQQTTITRHIMPRHVQDGITSPLISFAPTEIIPSTSADGMVETFYPPLEPDHSHNFYHVHVEISTVGREALPPTPRSSSQIQLAPTSRQLNAADSRERLLKTTNDLIPPWTDADDQSDNEGGEKDMKEPSVADSDLVDSRGSIFKLFRRRRK